MWNVTLRMCTWCEVRNFAWHRTQCLIDLCHYIGGPFTEFCMMHIMKQDQQWLKQLRLQDKTNIVRKLGPLNVREWHFSAIYHFKIHQDRSLWSVIAILQLAKQLLIGQRWSWANTHEIIVFRRAWMFFNTSLLFIQTHLGGGCGEIKSAWHFQHGGNKSWREGFKDFVQISNVQLLIQKVSSLQTHIIIKRNLQLLYREVRYERSQLH